MTLRLFFKGDISAYDLDKAIFPPASSHKIDVSDNSPSIFRNDLSVGKSGNQTWVEVDGIAKSEMSQATIDSIISIVPTDHIRTENV